jgi:hypothetical protein
LDDSTLLAPTPIVRITAEQLEYLISRIKRYDDADDRKRWRATTFTKSVVVAGTVSSFLPINKARIGFWIASPQASCLIGPIGTTAAQTGLLVSSATSLSLWVGRDTLGWQVTQGWEMFNTLANTNIEGLEVSTSYNWAD